MHQISKQIVLKNLIWKFAERCGAQAIAFIVSIILARILAPRDYGALALVLIFLSLLQVFADSGLGIALIQKKTADALDYSSVFFSNVVLAVLLYGLVWLSAPIIAVFYKMPEIVALLRVLGVTLLLFSLQNIQQAYVSRNMMFRKFFFATFSASLISAIVGIGMAYSGFGVWALAGQQLTNATVRTASLWLIVPWRPSWGFSWERWRMLFSFGWKMLASALFDSSYRQIWQLVIGKVYSPTDLAFYSQGEKFPQVVVSNISTSIDSVLLPTMATAQDDISRLREMTRRALKTNIFIMAPMMIGMAFMAELIVRVVLTEKWLPCVPFFCIACINYMFNPIYTVNLNALKALGRSDIFLALEIIKKIIGLILLLVTMRHGVLAMAYGALITTVIGQPINIWPTRRLIRYGYVSQFYDFFPSVLLAVLTGTLVRPISWLGWADCVTLFIQIVLGTFIYILGAIIFRLEAATYLWDALRSIFVKRP